MSVLVEGSRSSFSDGTVVVDSRGGDGMVRVSGLPGRTDDTEGSACGDGELRIVAAVARGVLPEFFRRSS